MSAVPPSAQEALERARAIAAKLSGTVPGADTGAAPAKRRRWDDATAGGGAAPGDGDDPKRARTAAAPPAAPGAAASTDATRHEKRIWIATTEERPAQHYVLHLKDHVTSLNDTEGSRGVSAALLGKGTDEPVVPGWPQLPLHILLTAPSHQQLAAFATTIQGWIEDADQAPALNYGEQALATVPPPSQDGATGGVTAYRPASVAQLIHGNPAATSDAPYTHHATLGVPHSVVGYVIGRGGATLAQIQAATGAAIHVQKEGELAPGQTQRQITLSAHDAEALAAAQRHIERLVREKCGPGAVAAAAAAPGLGYSKKHQYDAKVQEAIAAGHTHVIMHVPEDDVGLVIGKQGSTIRQIQDATGCHVQVMPASERGDTDDQDSDQGVEQPGTRTVHVTHPTEEGAQAAKTMIENLIKSRPASQGGVNGSFGGDADRVTIQISIPDRDVGLCIGKQGAVVRQMQNLTGCRIQIPPQCGPGEMHRIASVTGSREGTETVRRMIEMISAEQSSACVMSGDFNQYQMQRQQQGYHYGQQLPQQSDPSQQYSAEWAAYHAAQATAQQQLTQQPQTAPQYAAAPAPAAATPSADAYYEQFFRYAYYYGEAAARQYYGAWAPPPGTPNPYGVNPNPTAPPPSSQPAPETASNATTQPAAEQRSEAPAATAATSGAPTNAPRDSSRRRVSNLPAWMTKT